jgi:hypothetical protein
MRNTLGLMGSMVVLLGLGGCPSDDGGDETTGMVATSTGPASTSTGPEGTSTGMAESSGSTGPASTSDAESSSSGAVDGSSSSGGSQACEPPVVGEWNSCVDENGDIDNTLCNWMGNPDGTGFLTCLSAPPMDLEGGNICTIRGCRDVCDCFDPPATGTAPVVCAEILADGDTACGLDCSEGQTCPDGMECASGLCFWPPA